ncbi:sensor histidine kinase [Phreatobacter sp.]|uniref:sensor histidine kinase n=1 Tax=Phreatobacter sp. TaxID=1966341 RepID=UPI003F728878
MTWINPFRWPLTVKAPAMVVVFMLAVSAVITQAVLDRLRETQERHLSALSTTFLEGLASAVLPYVLREDIWEVFDAIERNATLSVGFGRAFITITDERGRTLASSNPVEVPLGADRSGLDRRFADGQLLIVDEEGGKAHARKVLRYQGRDVGRIFADYQIAHLVAERRDVLTTLIATNAFLTLCLAALAYWTIRRMLSPLARLSRHIDRSATGPLAPIDLRGTGHPASEFARLFRRYNALVEALAEREELARQLAAEERVASLGRLASGMAHEINNPLGGLFNAIDTLKAHGGRPAVRTSSIDLIERGLRGIRDVVRTVLATYRADREQRPLLPDDLDDMRLLIGSEVRRKRVTLGWNNAVASELALPASAVRQIMLNLILNAVSAVSEEGRVQVDVANPAGQLVITVADDGPGLSQAAADVLTGRSARPLLQGEGAGLGLWVSQRLAAGLGGRITAGAGETGGARITVTIPLAADGDLRDVA